MSDDEKTNGLRPMGRTAIHFFSLKNPAKVKSGARKTSKCFLGVNVDNLDIEFRISGNGVILCSQHLPKEHLFVIDETHELWEGNQEFLK